MTFFTIISILFLILTLTLTMIISKLFRLKRFRLNFADLAFPLLVLEIYLISDRAFYHSWLPQLAAAFSLLAISVTLYFLRVKRHFYYPKFIKFFWRAGFILTILLYLALIVTLFLT